MKRSVVHIFSCNCNNCANSKEQEPARRDAVQSILKRNSNAFKLKVKPDDPDAKHSKGCHCKNSRDHVNCMAMILWSTIKTIHN